MRPIDLHVAGGMILVFPAASVPASMSRAADRAGQAMILNRLAHDRRGLAELRNDWRMLGLATQRREAQLGEMLAALTRAAADRTVVLVWLPNHAGAPAPHPINSTVGKPVQAWGSGDKIAAALRRAISADHISKELGALVDELLSPLNIAVTVGMLLGLAAANALGVGVVADLVLVGLAWYFAGTTGVRAIWHFAEATVTVLDATEEKDIDRAAGAYAHALRELGTAFLAAFLARVQLKRMGTAAGKAEPAATPKPRTGSGEIGGSVRERTAQVGDATVVAKPINQPVYRVDDRTPETIFGGDGFQPRATATDLKTYVDKNIPSAFVSTSKTAAIADNPAFGAAGKYLYKIDGRQISGIDVNAVYPGNIFAGESEIAVLGGVPRSAIVSAQKILADGKLGDPIINPFFKGGK